MSKPLHLLAITGCFLLLGTCTPHAMAGSRNIPSVYRDDNHFNDEIVQRIRPDDALLKHYKFGRLGVLLPSYDREALYLAYRALVLDQGKLEQQARDTPKFVVEAATSKAGIPEWQALRASVTERALKRPLEQNRSFKGREFGQYLNCADGAFGFATETLQALKGNKKISPAELQDWLTAQDIVFDLCGDPDSSNHDTKIPQDLPASAPLYLRQLRQYQLATAYFYDEKYEEALRRFDLIANNKTHPMAGWASHAALRSLLRMGSLENSTATLFNDIRNSNATPEQKREAFGTAINESQRKKSQLHAQIVTRAKLILADKTRAAQHQAVRKLVVQAGLYIVPEQVYAELSDTLGRFDQDFEINRQLDVWSSIGNSLFDYGGNRDLINKLRKQHEYYDWIRSIQACTDNPSSPNNWGQCPQEAAHALEMWKKTRAKTWLIATLMTARQLTPEVEAVFAPALQAAPDSKEFLTVRYFIARLLRQAGRRTEAIAVIEQVLPASSTFINSRILPSAASANNLFRQEMLAMAKNEPEAIPYFMRDSVRGIGADADEILNRHLSSEDLLRLAKNPAIDNRLVAQLLVAAWWRSDMVGKKATAEAAARQLLTLEPGLSTAINTYLKTSDTEERHYVMAKIAMTYRISPQVFQIFKDMGKPRKSSVPNWWCSFSDDDFKSQARLQRIPTSDLDLTLDLVGREQEIRKLKQQGTAADWLARVALQRNKTNPDDPYLRNLFEAVVKSEELDCISADSENLLAAAKRVLAGMPGGRPATAAPAARISEEAIRARYDLYVNRLKGKQEFRVFHIMFKSEDDARQALNKIQNGSKFEDVARQSSLDPGSKQKGGDLNWVLPEVFVQPFADTVASMSKGGLYPKPVLTSYGWHLIEVRGTRPATVPPYEDVKKLLEEQLRKEQAK